MLSALRQHARVLAAGLHVAQPAIYAVCVERLGQARGLPVL